MLEEGREAILEATVISAASDTGFSSNQDDFEEQKNGQWIAKERPF